MFSLVIEENDLMVMCFNDIITFDELIDKFNEYITENYDLDEVYFDLGGVVEISFSAKYKDEIYDDEMYRVNEFKYLYPYFDIIKTVIANINQTIVINFKW